MSMRWVILKINNMEIKNIHGDVIFTSNENDIKAAVENAVATGANLSGANLSRANLSRANLLGADLSRAYLLGANLSGADLSRANLSRANLLGADLSGADLLGANLSGADLSGANLLGANLPGAGLSRANLSRANLSGVKHIDNSIAMTRILPEGDIIGYKKSACGTVIKLLIPADAKRSSAFGRKCRAEFAKVLDTGGKDVVYSSHDRDFAYRVGEIVKPREPFDDNFTNECASGIHFFITRLEAEQY